MSLGSRAMDVSVTIGPGRVRRGWPDVGLDVPGLRRSGRRAHPFTEFVLKVHGRCNLGCRYCYVYNSPDSRWTARTGRMPLAVARLAAERIADHARRHRLAQVAVVLHGGEPLLAGSAHLVRVAALVRAALAPGTSATVSVQTNGTLLDDDTLHALGGAGIRIGVSLDGTAADHDARRPTAAGSGSHQAVAAGIHRLASPAHRAAFGGLLCVVDSASDPGATYEHLVSYRPPRIDFLLPHGNWSAPPPGHRAGDIAHGRWLASAFDRWYPGQETSVRLFRDIIRGLLGRPSQSEAVGLAPATIVVVEVDGAIEHVDTLRTAYHGAVVTGLHIEHDSFDRALDTSHVAARQIGEAGLASTCRACDVRSVCGGGYYPHRYREGAGFLNPSVYCHDLEHLIRHIRARIEHDVARLAVARR